MKTLIAFASSSWVVFAVASILPVMNGVGGLPGGGNPGLLWFILILEASLYAIVPACLGALFFILGLSVSYRLADGPTAAGAGTFSSVIVCGISMYLWWHYRSTLTLIVSMAALSAVVSFSAAYLLASRR